MRVLKDLRVVGTTQNLGALKTHLKSGQDAIAYDYFDVQPESVACLQVETKPLARAAITRACQSTRKSTAQTAKVAAIFCTCSGQAVLAETKAPRRKSNQHGPGDARNDA